MALLRNHDTSILVIDMQTRLLPAIDDNVTLVETAKRFLQAARLLDIPVCATEHWAEKIGETSPDVSEHIDHVFHKTHFDATQEHGFQSFMPHKRHRVVLIGVEAHICVLQTGLGLKQIGFEPVLASDAIGSRRPSDRQAALDRWAHHGLEAVSTEMALFEWMQTPAHGRFRDVLALLK